MVTVNLTLNELFAVQDALHSYLTDLHSSVPHDDIDAEIRDTYALCASHALTALDQAQGLSS